MLSANKEKLQSFFSGSLQFQIPFFQRAYVWKEDNWLELWDDVLEELAAVKAGKTESEHFIGTIIIKSRDTGSLSAQVYDLIDGQQRLTTICLLLRALHDVSAEATLKTYLTNLLIFSDAYGKKNIRLLHSKADAKHFADIIQSADDNAILPATESRIVKAYTWFRKQAEESVADTDIITVVNILLQKLPVIHMSLSANDDVQQIFDTINSLGVKLTVGELLKNHVFAYKSVEPHYEKLWRDIFEEDEETIQFWEAEKTSGRVRRTNIDLFLYSFLVILTGGNVKLETLFKEFKAFLKGKSEADILHFARELADYASIYADLPEGKELADLRYDEHDKRFFHVMNELDVNTIFPLVLYVYKQVADPQERLAMLRLLESYIVRRTVCRLTTKNYNNLFIAIMNDLKKGGVVNAAALRAKLEDYDEDASRFPEDDDFKKAFFRTQLINKYSGEVLYGIALYHKFADKNDTSRLSKGGLTVEHMMPKNWRKHWKLAAGSSKVDEERRDDKLLTLGNLTLIKGKLNSSLRDSAWAKKQNGLVPYSSLRITTDYLMKVDWDETEIEARADSLAKDALTIWPK